MRIVRQLLLACLMAGVLGALGPAAAVASNCGGAGNQQYIDPLQCGGGGGGGGGTPSNNHPSSGGSGGGSSGTTSTPTTGTTPTASGTASDTSTTSTGTSTSTSSTSSTSASDPKSSKTLPYTGLDLAPVLLIAFGLLGGGFVLRRVVTDR